jgi:hypothetical protein
MFKLHEILSNIKSIGVIISILLLFAPVMKTVNQTYSDDTIYALTTGFISYHLIMRDYDYESKAKYQYILIYTLARKPGKSIPLLFHLSSFQAFWLQD